MDWIVQSLYSLVEVYWILGWPPTSWIVALLLVGTPITAIALTIRWLLSSGPSSAGYHTRMRSMGRDERE